MSSTPNRRSKPKAQHKTVMEPPASLFPSKQEFLRLIAVLAIASSVAFTCNLIMAFFNPTTKPFCDTNSHYPHSLSDFCEPCPEHGECSEGKFECAHGYRKHRNLCIQDGDINERAKKLSQWVENWLCEAYSKFLCDGVGKIWVQEDDIRKDLDGHKLIKSLGLDNPIYFYTKRNTMDIISQLLEMRTNNFGNKEFKCPDMLAEHYKPYSCQIRQWIFKQALIIVPVGIVVLGSMLLFLKLKRKRNLSARVQELYDQICDILEENAIMSKRAENECEPWVVASRLRDHLLLPRERKDPRLWKEVEELVQEDSRVDRYPKLVKGESKVVWEWQVEGSLSSARMRKKRDANKSKLSEGNEANSSQQRHMLKFEPKIPML